MSKNGERWSDEESEEAREEREEKKTIRGARVKLRCSEGQWSWRTVENGRVGKDLNRRQSRPVSRNPKAKSLCSSSSKEKRGYNVAMKDKSRS
jgi:hypothetical protein